MCQSHVGESLNKMVFKLCKEFTVRFKAIGSLGLAVYSEWISEKLWLSRMVSLADKEKPIPV